MTKSFKVTISDIGYAHLQQLMRTSGYLTPAEVVRQWVTMSLLGTLKNPAEPSGTESNSVIEPKVPVGTLKNTKVPTGTGKMGKVVESVKQTAENITPESITFVAVTPTTAEVFSTTERKGTGRIPGIPLGKYPLTVEEDKLETACDQYPCKFSCYTDYKKACRSQLMEGVSVGRLVESDWEYLRDLGIEAPWEQSRAPIMNMFTPEKIHPAYEILSRRNGKPYYDTSCKINEDEVRALAERFATERQ